jgi:PAS domain S-box-containing protein
MRKDRDLARAYARGLAEYVSAPSELTLQAAYETARWGIAEGVGVVELVNAHHQALEALFAESPGADAAGLRRSCGVFLLEALSTFEMSLRGFRETVGKLEREVAERRNAEEALHRAHDELEERVGLRTRELSEANQNLRREIEVRSRAEAALRETELRYEALVASILDYGILMLEPDGSVASWNQGAARIKGYRAEEIIGRHFSIFYTPEDRAAGRPQQMLERAISEGSYRDEGWRVRKDGSRFWADVLVTALRSPEGVLQGFTKVTRDSTERRRAQEALQKANADLRRADQEKDAFIAMVSHELRNPLAAIIAGAEFLRRVLPQDENIQRPVDIIRRNANLQKRLVNDLLDISRLARDRLQLQRAPVALDLVAQSVVGGQESEATRAGIALTLEAGTGLWTLGDSDRLQQVVLNLVGNAIKFTPAGGRIRVILRRCPVPVPALLPEHTRAVATPGPAAAGFGSILIVVEDTGIGIDRAKLHTVFNMFEQGEVAGGRQRGLGLGLALVKLITEKHGGKVWAESEGPNQGSRFVAAFPELGVEPAGTRLREGPIRLLLVEDNPDTRALLAVNLRAYGHEVVEAESGEDALAALETHGIDLVLADLGLPGIGGYELLRRARLLPGRSDLPAFAVTGLGSDEDMQRVREAGFSGHFVKPVDVQALDRGIRALLRRSGPLSRTSVAGEAGEPRIGEEGATPVE